MWAHTPSYYFPLKSIGFVLQRRETLPQIVKFIRSSYRTSTLLKMCNMLYTFLVNFYNSVYNELNTVVSHFSRKYIRKCVVAAQELKPVDVMRAEEMGIAIIESKR